MGRQTGGRLWDTGFINQADRMDVQEPGVRTVNTVHRNLVAGHPGDGLTKLVIVQYFADRDIDSGPVLALGEK